VRSHPRPWAFVAAHSLTARAELERTVGIELVAGAGAGVAIEGVEQLAQVAGRVGRVAQRMRDGCGEDNPLRVLGRVGVAAARIKAVTTTPSTSQPPARSSTDRTKHRG
jgi:hypothetical protein